MTQKLYKKSSYKKLIISYLQLSTKVALQI